MGGRSSGGTSTQSVNMPEFLETGLQQAMGQGRDAAQTGYVPYYGVDIAAPSPMMEASRQGTNMMADAFGMPTASNQSYLPETQTMGGVTGYSSAPIFEAAKENLANKNPGQADYIDSFTIDPVTGAAGSRALENQPVALEMQVDGRKGK